jgi:hypothetical protein
MNSTAYLDPRSHVLEKPTVPQPCPWQPVTRPYAEPDDSTSTPIILRVFLYNPLKYYLKVISCLQVSLAKFCMKS